MDGELAAQFSMAYVANYWRTAKTVYNFAPEFLRTLAETEDAPIYSDIMMRLPYRDFVMNLPAGFHHDAMFVHIEFDASHGPNDVDTLFLIVPFKANPNFDNIELCQCMQWCLNGKKLIESYRRNNELASRHFRTELIPPLSMTPRFQMYPVPFSVKKSWKSSGNSTPALSRIFVLRFLQLITLHPRMLKSKR